MNIKKCPFYHPFKDGFGNSPEQHTWKGNLTRHLVVEHLIKKYQALVNDYLVNTPIFAQLVFGAIEDILFGLNCNFPISDVFRFTTYSACKMKEDLEANRR